VLFVAIFEPFVDVGKIEGYRRFLGFHHCLANNNGKIWCFWTFMDYTEIIYGRE